MNKISLSPEPALMDASPEELTGAHKAAARELGADLVGIADPKLLADEPASARPQSIFPEVAAVIVIGRRITRGTLRGIEEGTNWNTYECFGRRWLEDQFVAHTAFELVSFAEDLGHEAVPLFGYPAELAPAGVAVAEGRPAPNVIVDVRVAAVAAGLGEIGRLGELITPEFGPLQKLSLILTDAPLVPDRPRSFGFCDGCSACAEACPLDAVSTEALSDSNRGGASWQEFGIDAARCSACRNGAVGGRFVGSSRPDRIPAACGRACLASLEERGLLERHFRNAFRVREPWSVDAFGQVDSGGRS